MVAEMIPLYGPIDGPQAPSATAADFSPPRGSFVVLYDGGAPIAGGGIKGLDHEACEIKRMYVVPERRGQGIARVLLGALEDEAQRLGYTVARLDTGPKQPGAQKLYETAGYTPIGNFNNNPFASYWGEKRLVRSSA
jgi:GNAT superfamily N-acetyltransferase